MSAFLAGTCCGVPWLGIDVPIGIFMILGWGMGLGGIMWREAKRAELAGARSAA